MMAKWWLFIACAVLFIFVLLFGDGGGASPKRKYPTRTRTPTSTNGLVGSAETPAQRHETSITRSRQDRHPECLEAISHAVASRSPSDSTGLLEELVLLRTSGRICDAHLADAWRREVVHWKSVVLIATIGRISSWRVKAQVIRGMTPRGNAFASALRCLFQGDSSTSTFFSQEVPVHLHAVSAIPSPADAREMALALTSLLSAAGTDQRYVIYGYLAMCLASQVARDALRSALWVDSHTMAEATLHTRWEAISMDDRAWVFKELRQALEARCCELPDEDRRRLMGVLLGTTVVILPKGREAVGADLIASLGCVHIVAEVLHLASNWDIHDLRQMRAILASVSSHTRDWRSSDVATLSKALVALGILSERQNEDGRRVIRTIVSEMLRDLEHAPDAIREIAKSLAKDIR